MERVTGLKLSSHKMRVFFKKWMDLEERHGDEDTREQVRQAVVDLVWSLLIR